MNKIALIYAFMSDDLLGSVFITSIEGKVVFKYVSDKSDSFTMTSDTWDEMTELLFNQFKMINIQTCLP